MLSSNALLTRSWQTSESDAVISGHKRVLPSHPDVLLLLAQFSVQLAFVSEFKSLSRIQVIPLGHAAKEGIQAGDILRSLNGKAVLDLNFEEIQRQLKKTTGILRISLQRWVMINVKNEGRKKLISWAAPSFYQISIPFECWCPPASLNKSGIHPESLSEGHWKLSGLEQIEPFRNRIQLSC